MLEWKPRLVLLLVVLVAVVLALAGGQHGWEALQHGW
jgi:hypothetical protein